MTEKDTTQKTLESHNDVFADIVNALLFKGEQIVKEEELSDAQAFSQYKAEGDKIHAQERDVAKYWESDAIRLSFIGFENQTIQESDMPLRVISYDGAAYRSQLLSKKEKTHYPVVTMVLYFGTKYRWKKPRSLKECLGISDKLSPFVSDYKINVFELAWLTDEEINYFKSDFKLVVEYLRAKRTGTAGNWDRQKILHISEILDLLKVISNDNMFMEMESYISQTQQKEGGIKMDSFLQKAWDKGETSAIEKITALFSKLFASGRDEDVKKATNDREYLKKLLEEYQK